MDSNSFGKLLPKAISAKRRRKKQSSIAETTSSNDEVTPERGRSIASRQTTDSFSGNVADNEESSQVSYESDPES